MISVTRFKLSNAFIFEMNSTQSYFFFSTILSNFYSMDSSRINFSLSSVVELMIWLRIVIVEGGSRGRVAACIGLMFESMNFH